MNTLLRLAVLAIALSSLAPSSTQATIPEPDNLLYGIIVVGTNQITSAQTNVTVQVRRSPTGPAIASCAMGDTPNTGNFYSLSVTLESLAPLLDSSAAQTGDLLYLVVLSNSVALDQQSFTAGTRGQILRLDLGNIDLDHNGLRDGWEEGFFGHTGVDPDSDPAHNGFSVLQAYLYGLNPLVSQALHPCDNNPADSDVSISEVVAYALAWYGGHPWQSPPTTIPDAFVARAAALWKNGEYYLLNTNLASAAPAWWINSTNRPKDAQPKDLGTYSVTSVMPSNFTPGIALWVTNAAAFPPTVAAYTISDTLPANWAVTNISNGGKFDSANNKVKWLLWDNVPRPVSYQLLPPTNAAFSVTLSGLGSFDGLVEVATTGQRQLRQVLVPCKFLASSEFRSDGSFHLRASAGANRTYHLETSSDLKAWTAVADVQFDAAGQLDYGDTQPVAGSRFYRLHFAY